MEGFHVMLCFLAARGWAACAPAPGAIRRAVAAFGLVVLGLSGVYAMARDAYAIAYSRRPERAVVRMDRGDLVVPEALPADRWFRGSPWLAGILLRRVDRYDLPRDLLETLAWAATRLDRGTVVLAAPETGLLVPMFTPHRVVAGHLFGTLRSAEKELAVRAVMDGRLPDGARRWLLGRLGAGALLLDDRLKALGTWRPGPARWLTELHASGGVRLLGVAAAPAVPPVLETHLQAEAGASMAALAGRDLLDQGRPADAIAPLRHAAAARPADDRIRAWLAEALQAAGSAPPPPPGRRPPG